MTRRATWGQALKEAAIKFAREAERFVGAQDDAPCGACAHARSEHCGCGMHCFGALDGTTPTCACQGFAAKPEPKAEG
jgi:hypothetical protein